MDSSSTSAQIHKILQSRTFANKRQLRRLLEVLSTNIDSQETLAADLIIRELWPDEVRTKRSADVATEMNRLRHALKNYYEGEGAGDAVLIALPNRAPTAGNSSHERPWIVAQERGGANGTEGAVSIEQGFTTSEHEPPVRSSRYPVGIAAVALVAAVLGFLFRPALPAPRITGSTQVTHDGRDKERLVTDGPRVYFSSYPDINPRLYQVPASGGDTVPLETAIPAPFLFDMSPDHSELLVGSCYVGRTTSECPLWIMPVLGRPPRRVGDIAASDANWSPDGKWLAYINGNNLFIATSAGGDAKRIVNGTPGETLSWPRWSPDGKRLRFSVSTPSNETSLWEVSAKGGDAHRFLSGWNTPPSECCGSWTPDGNYFLFQSNRGGSTNVWAIREGRSILRKASDQPVQLTTGPTSAGTVVPGADKLFVTTARSGELVRYDSKSQEFAPYLSGLSATGVNFSADGKWMTYVAYPEHTLWRSKLDGSERLQLTFTPLYVMQPRWSPDGTQIAFMALQGDKPWSIYTISADGGTPERPVAGDNGGLSDPTWSPDGTRLLFARRVTEERTSTGLSGLEIVDLRTHEVSRVPGSDRMWSPRWSRDGRYILAVPLEADRLMVFDVASQKWTELAKLHVSYPEWSHDGDYIYALIKSKNEPATVLVRVHIKNHQIEQVASLRNFKQPRVDWGEWAGLAPDDAPILLREAGTPEIYALDWERP